MKGFFVEGGGGEGVTKFFGCSWLPKHGLDKNDFEKRMFILSCRILIQKFITTKN